MRTKWTDPDFRKTPKTNCFCILCQRDIKPEQSHREIAVDVRTWEAIHRDEWEIAARSIPSAEFYIGPVGIDCARRIGLEFTRDKSK